MSLNLHNIAAGALGLVQELEPIAWFKSLGQTNIKGVLTPLYAEPAWLDARVQSLSDQALAHADKQAENSITRKFYLYSTREAKVDGLVRQDGRGGDLLYYLGEWWLVDGLLEDFSAQGWVCVRGVLLTALPALETPQRALQGGENGL